MEEIAGPYIHFMGYQGNVRSFYSMSDAGILPTYYKGESYPLTVIECLQSNRPVIVTDIAETKKQLDDENGGLAGILIPQDPSTGIQIDALREAVYQMAVNRELYVNLKECCQRASRKFDMKAVTEKYLEVYQEVLEQRR